MGYRVEVQNGSDGQEILCKSIRSEVVARLFLAAGGVTEGWRTNMSSNSFAFVLPLDKLPSLLVVKVLDASSWSPYLTDGVMKMSFTVSRCL